MKTTNQTIPGLFAVCAYQRDDLQGPRSEGFKT